MRVLTEEDMAEALETWTVWNPSYRRRSPCSDWKLVGKPTDIDRERREWLAEARKIIKGEIPRNATRSELDSWRIGLEASLPGHPDIAKALTIVNRELR